MSKEERQLTIEGDFQTLNVVLELEHGVHAKAKKKGQLKNLGRKFTLFCCINDGLNLTLKEEKITKKNKIKGKYCIHHSHLANFTKIFFFNK